MIDENGNETAVTGEMARHAYKRPPQPSAGQVGLFFMKGLGAVFAGGIGSLLVAALILKLAVLGGPIGLMVCAVGGGTLALFNKDKTTFHGKFLFMVGMWLAGLSVLGLAFPA
ncbi:MAG: hypothetical protein ACPG80_02265 [Rickettsiales bacterium]